ncbi:hypothetical protein CFC21_096692 [Triticum aestivum]|uniref:Phosphoserine phosphatase n=2 Tax=Triticum aestivum TaxID=4565 RepID=A0A9R1LSY2_WHEAT|nr:hypothetical protein CFC21_096692 [Triticum aestivum]
MASSISARTSARHTLSVSPLSSVRSAQTSQLAIRAANPLFPCAKLSQARAVVAAPMKVSKHPSSSCLANRQPSKEVLETWRSADAVCFDVDSTVCLDEGIDELADFCGAGQAVAEWTTKAMTGTVPFEEALAARISLIKPSLSQVQDCLEKRPPRISPGIADLIKTLIANNTEVFLVSGGFRQMIEDRGYKTLVMIGDGATDLEAWQPGGADLFICYAGVQMREAVAAKADWTVFEFQELISELPQLNTSQ